jgi:acyl phosphate:glycerol-3-phosphate acyltransferase
VESIKEAIELLSVKA